MSVRIKFIFCISAQQLTTSDMYLAPLRYLCGGLKPYIRFVQNRSITRNNFLNKTWTLNSCIPCIYSAHNRLTRTVSTEAKPVEGHASAASFTTVYRFNYIVHLKVLARLKIYQTVFTLVAVPQAFYLHSSGDLSTQMLYASAGLASLACIMLYVMSFSIRKVVGILAMSDDNMNVKISHLSFWGKRKDILCDVSDIVPLADMSESPTHVYVKLKRYSTSTDLNLFVRHGRITDISKLQNILGSLK